MKAHYAYMKNESFRIFQIHDLNKHDCHVFGFVSQRYNPAKFKYAPSVLRRSHRPFSPRTYVINWNQVFFNWFPAYSERFRAENLKLEDRPVTRILCGGVLTRPKWTKLPKCIFYLILFNWRPVNFKFF